ncbi:reverse transcriptase domain-containing protein [Tanacetum coccineum]
MFPPLANNDGTEGPLVIEAEIGGHMIHRMYIDGGSYTEILYEHCFKQLRPEIKNQMVPTTTSLTGFSGETIWPLGQLRLLVTIGDAYHSTKAWMNFMIVRSLSPYNGIIGRPGIREIQAVPSTAHGMLKFPANGGIFTIHSTILIPAECTTVITSSKEVPKEAEVRPKNFKIALHPNFPDQEKKKGQAPERSKAIQAEVQKLAEAGIMREVYYHDWLSNPVMLTPAGSTNNQGKIDLRNLERLSWSYLLVLDDQKEPRVQTPVLVEILKEKSIHEEEVATVVEEEGNRTWDDPDNRIQKEGTLLGDIKEQANSA